MIAEKKNKISVVGILTHNLMVINDHTVEWVDAKEFSLASIAKVIGVNEENKVKARLTLEVVEEPCEICHALTAGDKLCNKCEKLVCDVCAKTDPTGRYCPLCFDAKNQPATL